ncbi:hypothetical protein M422DRAFT_31219 [Sphaerobolus stellatus SS14]|uniref:Unplaced genomic scaffold SPHSTscaffold_53, whole genome shotgun sequence n=1 Tax=Sphaerobolus stellatus (strain SS14) TaxID=990650 RepID=A0A0C9V6L8_SPHS4|nr:hypothetical protein M422DRAFT_31219 [Sphaerobolus stellatus SS14]
MCFAAPERTVGPSLRRQPHDVYVVRMQSGRDRNAAYLARQWYYLQRCARQAEDDEGVGWWNGWQCVVCKLHNEVLATWQRKGDLRHLPMWSLCLSSRD